MIAHAAAGLCFRAVRLARPRGRALSSCGFTRCGHPLIDIAPLLHEAGSSEARRQSVQHLRAALVNHGYFYAANVDVLPAEYIRSIYEYSQRAHALPASVKHKYRQRGGTGACTPVPASNAEDWQLATGSLPLARASLSLAFPAHWRVLRSSPTVGRLRSGHWAA